MKETVISILHIVQFSGGAASSYVAKMVADENPGKTILLFHDTKAEHPDAYRFRKQVSEYIGLPITEVSDGRSLWEVIYHKKCIPDDGRFPFCTEILKLNQAKRFFKTLTEEFTVYNGFGINEWNRVQKATVRAEAEGYKARSLLCEKMIPDYIVKDTIKNKWRICLPLPYLYLRHNNCIPCFKAGKGHFYKVWKHFPDKYEKAVQVELAIGYTVFDDISLTQLREKWSKEKFPEEMFQEANLPCMCAI